MKKIRGIWDQKDNQRKRPWREGLEERWRVYINFRRWKKKYGKNGQTCNINQQVNLPDTVKFLSTDSAQNLNPLGIPTKWKRKRNNSESKKENGNGNEQDTYLILHIESFHMCFIFSIPCFVDFFLWPTILDFLGLSSLFRLILLNADRKRRSCYLLY